MSTCKGLCKDLSRVRAWPSGGQILNTGTTSQRCAAAGALMVWTLWGLGVDGDAKMAICCVPVTFYLTCCGMH